MINSLYADEKTNIGKIEDTKKSIYFHTRTLSTKVKRNKKLEKIKEEVLEAKENAIKCITTNMSEQIKAGLHLPKDLILFSSTKVL